MQHLTEEQLVAFHYRDGDAPAAAAHLTACPSCATEYETIRRVLALVSEAPIPDRGDRYGEEVWTRLRWKLGSRERRRRWQSLTAVAALLTIAFFAGLFFRTRPATAPTGVQQATTSAGPSTSDEGAERLLASVVSDHLDTSGRMLLEVANANATDAVTTKSSRAEDLVSANRIYRQTAQQQGDERIAQLLSDLEPILLELANAGGSLEGKKLAELQNRIESKGLLFKVRVMSAPPVESTTTTTGSTDSI
jgi:hypothetical protein